MPIKSEVLHIKLPKVKGADRRYKLSAQERDEIYENVEGLRVMQLARKYNVTHRTIRNVQYPEIYEQSLADFRERRKDGRYYNKEYQRLAIKETRKRRKKLLIHNG